MALIKPDLVNPFGQIDPKTVRAPDDVDDSAALQIVVQDAMRTESWQQNNFWGLRWREADALYQSPPGVIMWEGTSLPRANMNRYVVAETVNTIHEQVMNGYRFMKLQRSFYVSALMQMLMLQELLHHYFQSS